MHAHYVVHPRPPFPHAVEAWRVLSFTFFVYLCVFPHVASIFLHFFPWLGSCLGNAQCWALSFTNCCRFPHCACPRNPFWCCGVNGQQRITILGFIVVDLAHAIPRFVAEFKFLILGCFSPFYQSVFCCKMFFINLEFCILLHASFSLV